MSTPQSSAAASAPNWAHSLGMFLVFLVVLTGFGYLVLDRGPVRAVVIASVIALAMTALERWQAPRRATAVPSRQVGS